MLLKFPNIRAGKRHFSLDEEGALHKNDAMTHEMVLTIISTNQQAVNNSTKY